MKSVVASLRASTISRFWVSALDTSLGHLHTDAAGPFYVGFSRYPTDLPPTEIIRLEQPQSSNRNDFAFLAFAGRIFSPVIFFSEEQVWMLSSQQPWRYTSPSDT